MPLLSVIIPIYNARTYIEKCIKSILRQNFRDYELILVDDGSVDGSGYMCDAYAGQDNRIYVIHQLNQGVSAARNAGLEAAAGRYICFVDADDWIEPDLFQVCIDTIESSGADILQHGMTRSIWKDGEEVSSSKRYIISDSVCLTKEQLGERIQDIYSSVSVNVFNYIYKRELLQTIRFDTGMPYSEDNVFAMQALRNANVYYFLNNYGYHYNVRAGSAAYKWQPEMIMCYLKTFYATQTFFRALHIVKDTERHLMADRVVNGYASLVYNLCLPSCSLKYKEKLHIARRGRRLFKVDRYKKYYHLEKQSLFSKAKTILTFCHIEWFLILFGSIYLGGFENDKTKN